MGGLADQRGAVRGEALDGKAAYRHAPTPALDGHRADDRMGLPLDRAGEAGIVERGDLVGLARRQHPDKRGTAARQRHQRARPGAGVELGRGVAMLAAMAENRGQRDLRISPVARLDASGGANP